MELQETLRARGYRLTPQRQLVLDAVTELGHATPDEACAWVKERSSAVNISTIYRTLELLEELGPTTRPSHRSTFT
jgi:Fur family ferric uptake transcriptional regulator